MKADKHYCIRYSRSGIYQYADFSELDGKIMSKRFYPIYVNMDEIPSLDNANTIKAILKIIKKFSYNNIAEIYLINGVFPKYYRNKPLKSDIIKYSTEISNLIDAKCLNLFYKHIAPMLIKNKWFVSTSQWGMPVIIYKDKKGKWDNIPDCQDNLLIEFICMSFLNDIGIAKDEVKMREEYSVCIHSFAPFMSHINYNDVKSLGLFVTLE
jgi:hypothetical protein